MERAVATSEAFAAPRVGIPASEVKAKLYGVRGSPPSASAELMLHHKGVEYRRVNLIAMLHRKRLPRKGFPGSTVPALVLNGRRVQTNPAIARALDEQVFGPPLFPEDPDLRAKVEEAERFGDEVLQPATRRMVFWSFVHDPDSVRFHPTNGKLLIPRNSWLQARVMPKVFETYGVTESVVREDFDRLPSRLDRLDRWVAEGVLDNPRLTAADYEIAPLIGALIGVGDLGAEIGKRLIAGLPARALPRW
jgi:glutathione S-transferase